MIAAPAARNAATASAASQRGWMAQRPKRRSCWCGSSAERSMVIRSSAGRSLVTRVAAGSVPGGVTPGFTSVSACSSVPGTGSPRSA